MKMKYLILSIVCTFGIALTSCKGDRDSNSYRVENTNEITDSNGISSLEARYNANAWRALNGEPTNLSIFTKSGLLALPRYGIESFNSMNVTKGDVLEVSYIYEIEKFPTNDAPINFYLGPIIYSASGDKLFGWKRVQMEEVFGDKKKVSYEIVVPDQGARVNLGVSGSWQKNRRASDVVFKISKFSVKKIS